MSELDDHDVARMAAKLVGELADVLPAGTDAVVLIFDDQGATMCLSRRPIPIAFELVHAWVLDRLEERDQAASNTPQA